MSLAASFACGGGGSDTAALPSERPAMIPVERKLASSGPARTPFTSALAPMTRCATPYTTSTQGAKKRSHSSGTHASSAIGSYLWIQIAGAGSGGAGCTAGNV